MPLEQWKIGKITINRHDVFDTGSPLDKRFPYTWANKLHIVTRESRIRAELLFTEGGPYDPVLLEETERILRKTRLFRTVSITAGEPYNGVVDIHIQTHDVWTLSILLTYGRVGGRDLYGVGVLERNLLGTGIQVGGFIRKEIDRLKKGLTFRHPRVFHTPVDVFAGYGKDEKGEESEVKIEKPFRSVLDHSKVSASGLVSDDEGQLFENGDEVALFRHQTDRVRAEGWINPSPNPKTVHRMGMIYQYEEDSFSRKRFLLPLPQPLDRKISAVMLGYHFEKVRYRKERGVITLDREEDLNLGWDVQIEAGPSLESLGATRDGALVQGGIQKNWIPSPDVFLFTDIMAMSRVEENRLQNGVLKITEHMVFRDWWKDQTATLTVRYKGGRRLDPERQFLLGGETGLRGYSVRQLSGSKSLIGTLENRQVILYDWLQLISVGWGVFFDTGSVWKKGESLSLSRFKSDVGMGIRFAPTRSVNPNIIRIDLAYALNDNDRGSRWVFNVTGEILFGRKTERKFDQ